MTVLSKRSSGSLERELSRLLLELWELQRHPAYPHISDIPGYQACLDRIDAIEYELDSRAEFGEA